MWMDPGPSTQLRPQNAKWKNCKKILTWSADYTQNGTFAWIRSSDDAKSTILRVVGGPVGGPDILGLNWDAKQLCADANSFWADTKQLLPNANQLVIKMDAKTIFACRRWTRGPPSIIIRCKMSDSASALNHFRNRENLTESHYSESSGRHSGLF